MTTRVNRRLRWVVGSIARGSILPLPIALALAPISAADPADPCSMADLLACAEQNAALPPSGASDVAGTTDPVLQPGGGSELGIPAGGGPPEVYLPSGPSGGGSDIGIPAGGGPPEVFLPTP